MHTHCLCEVKCKLLIWGPVPEVLICGQVPRWLIPGQHSFSKMLFDSPPQESPWVIETLVRLMRFCQSNSRKIPQTFAFCQIVALVTRLVLLIWENVTYDPKLQISHQKKSSTYSWALWLVKHDSLGNAQTFICPIKKRVMGHQAGKSPMTLLSMEIWKHMHQIPISPLSITPLLHTSLKMTYPK